MPPFDLFNKPNTTEENPTPEVVNEEVPFQTEVVPEPQPEGEQNVPTEPTEEKKIDTGDNQESEVVLENTSVEDNVQEPQVDEVVQPTGPDPSFNCPNCSGSGLVVNQAIPQGKICDACGGTGKQ